MKKNIPIKMIAILMLLVMFVGCGNNTSSEGSQTSSANQSSGESSVVSSDTISTGTTSSETVSKEKPIIVNEELYVPTVVTLSVYGSDDYGVTWQTTKAPYEPVVQVSKGKYFDVNNYIEFAGSYEVEKSLGTSKEEITFYVSKAILTNLESNTEYTYRCYDSLTEIGGDTFTFKTRNTSSNVLKFVHVGDSQTATQNATSADGSNTGNVFNQTMLGVQKNGFKPDLIVHTGDIVEYSKYESYWHSMINTNSHVFASVPFAAVSGNHETSYRNGTREVYKHFNFNFHQQDVSYGFSYSFDYGNTKFIMLDTNDLVNNMLPRDEYEWLIETLENNTQKWTIVVMHNPMYSVGKYGSDPAYNETALGLRQQLNDIFVLYGVDVVIQGHDHAYSKTYPIGVRGVVNKNLKYEEINGVQYCTNANGVVYVMNGPAGNQPRGPVDGVEKEYYEKYSLAEQSSWAEFEVTDNLLTVRVYYYNNGSPKLWTSYGIKK